MTAVLRALPAVGTALLLVLGIAPFSDGPSPAPRSAPAVLAAQAQEAAPAPPPAPVPEDTDHDGCPKPWEQPRAASCFKPPPPPSRNGGPPPQRSRSVEETAHLAGTSGAGASALRWARPTGPRLPVFRC
ncbi:hypothetical protein [Sphaerisporangium album]|uniref:hypothetical protein n=1 Tax=Sphaerisporangium album TaxID=509200 RepID=UPI0011C05AF6|nr:hypothetical protein [Sphaerisporangium album]